MFRLPEEIKTGLADYGDTIRRFARGTVSPGRFVGVRVPWGNYTQRGGRTYMARIRIPAGILTPRQLGALAHCARELGSGTLHLTTRQDIQIHDVEIDDVIRIHEYLKDHDLSSRGGGGNTVRNITACHLAGVCPEERFDVSGDAIALTEHFLPQDSSYTLPRKLKIAFSGCTIDCARCLVNDVGMVAGLDNGRACYRVFVGGGMGAHSGVARELEASVPREEIGNVVSAIKNVFYVKGDRKNRHQNRLRFLIGNIGFDEFRILYREELSRIDTHAPVRLRDAAQHHDLDAPDPEVASVADERYRESLAGDVVEQKQPGYVAVRLRIPRGDLGWKTAGFIAGLAKQFEQMQLRATQDQGLTLVNIRRWNLPDLHRQLADNLDGFRYPGTLLDVVACKGSRTCNLGLCNSPALAEAIERVIEDNFIGTKVFEKLGIRINGCPNACGQHPIGLVSLVGVVRKIGGRPVPFYRLLLAGQANVPDTRLAKETGVLIPVKNVPSFLKAFLGRIESELREDEGVQAYLAGRGAELAKEVSADYEHVPPYPEDPSYYSDLGGTEAFSMEGLAPGECGAGVIDMIKADLQDAAAALQRASRACEAQEIQAALFYAARALLVVKGSDPTDPHEALDEFVEKFIEAGIASHEYRNAKALYDSLEGMTTEAKREEAYGIARALLDHVTGLYEVMDSSFQFPTRKKEQKSTEMVRTLDLRGIACPLNYVKAKLYLDQLATGDVVDILLDAGEPIQNVPGSLENDGQGILGQRETDGHYAVTVEKRV